MYCSTSLVPGLAKPVFDCLRLHRNNKQSSVRTRSLIIVSGTSAEFAHSTSHSADWTGIPAVASANNRYRSIVLVVLFSAGWGSLDLKLEHRAWWAYSGQLHIY
jgi:hypothetical protein